MQTTTETQANAELERIPASLLDLPVAKLQIVQASEVVKESRLDRSLLEPTLTQNADGLWLLIVRRQGTYGQFDVPYIGTEMILADVEL